MTALPKLVSELLAVIAGFGTYASDGNMPQVTLVPHHVLEAEVCGKPCPVYAYFDPKKGILLDRRLDPVGDVNARSILLHELVHFVQWKTAGRNPKNCREWLSRESEAYDIQFRWLSRQTKGQRRFPVRRPVLSPVQCRADAAPLSLG
ncbi:MAG: hypothetical protein ACR2PM_05375 [Hyphomicrobiales bacterium]